MTKKQNRTNVKAWRKRRTKDGWQYWSVLADVETIQKLKEFYQTIRFKE